MTDFIKLNSYQEDNAIYVRTTAIVAIHTSNQGMTNVFMQGLEQPLDIMQTPDEILAMMRDDGASLPARHVVEHQAENAPAVAPLAPPPEGNDNVETGYPKAG